MAWQLAAAAIGTQIGGQIMGMRAADKAAEEERRIQDLLEARMDLSVAEIEGFADEYIKDLDEIERNFDPFAIAESYNNFYESVVRPMELEFDDVVLPEITAAYSGGVFGPEAFMSGAAKEATLRAKQQLATTKGQLRARERERQKTEGFEQNVMLRGLKEETASKKLKAQTMAPSLRVGQAGKLHKAEQGTIASRLAARNTRSEALMDLPSTVISGIEAGRSLEEMVSRRGTGTGEG